VRPLDGWRQVYESFSPMDLEAGERQPRVPQSGADSRRAAVLVPVLPESEGAWLVYTVRKDHLKDHAGQVSFPGGNSVEETLGRKTPRSWRRLYGRRRRR
jgi:hypothetical protein